MFRQHGPKRPPTPDPGKTFRRWFAIGLVFAFFLVWAQASAVDGLAGLLQVGESSALRPVIENQLGDIPVSDGPGHDGQIYYAIGLDLNGDEVAPLLNNAAYRYRRILYPLIASLGGLLDGWTLLYGMIAIATVSMAVGTGLVAAMASRSKRSELLALTVLLNPGVWLSVQLLTPDVMALALMLLGLYFVIDVQKRVSLWFSLSALAKDVFLATPVPLGIHRRAWRLSVIPVLVTGIWMGILTALFGNGFVSRGNLDWPFVGWIEASANWPLLDTPELVYLGFSLLCVAAGIVFSLRRNWMRWPIVTWTLLAIISSNWVWDFGNNAARAFAPIAVLIGVSFTHSIFTVGEGTVVRDVRSGAL